MWRVCGKSAVPLTKWSGIECVIIGSLLDVHYSPLCFLQGYEVSSDELTMTLQEFTANFAPNGAVEKQKLNFFTEKPTDDPAKVSERIFVYFSDEKNVSIKTMRKFLEILDAQKITNGMIIFSDKMTSSARKVISAMSAEYTLEEFEEASLLVNITQHVLVPQHEVLTPEEKKLLLQKYRLKDTQLPRIQLSDPVARYYGLKRGQVVKITRPSETSGRYASYRIAF